MTAGRKGAPQFTGLERAHSVKLQVWGGVFGELPSLEPSVQGPVYLPGLDYKPAFPLCLFSIFTLI